MKTPQEWIKEMKLRPCVTENDLIVIIKSIQDDALASVFAALKALTRSEGE